MDNYSSIFQTIGCTFKNRTLLKIAFTHSSYANEHKYVSNERLEYLGDSVLSLIISDYLYRNFGKSEGDLSKMRASLVSESSLAIKFSALKLDKFLFVGEGLKHSEPTDAMKADAFEALVAAIYLDRGLSTASNFVLDTFREDLKALKLSGVPESNKSKLNELFPSKVVAYKTEVMGEGNQKHYDCVVYINGKAVGRGKARKKRVAEEKAALETLKNLEQV